VTDDERALLWGVLLDPPADLPRLVYADWLEENGQETRAAIIRLQIEAASTPICSHRAVEPRNGSPGREAVEGNPARAKALFDESMVRVGFLGLSRGGATWSRGFVSEWTCSSFEWLTARGNGDMLNVFSAWPIEQVFLRDAWPFNRKGRYSIDFSHRAAYEALVRFPGRGTIKTKGWRRVEFGAETVAREDAARALASVGRELAGLPTRFDRPSSGG
jgi:uncharacterized protein (TIGR02996 family)